MGSSSYADECNECGGEIHKTEGSDDYYSGDCIDCGYSYYTTKCQLELEEVNDLREDMGYEPLEKLGEQDDS